MPPSSPSLFETARLRARRLLREDVGLIESLYGDEESVRYLGVPPLRDVSEAEMQLQRMLERNERYAHCKGAWVLERRQDGRSVGVILCKHPRRSAANGALAEELEVGWHLRPDARGHGYATEAARAILAYAFDELESAEVYILTEPPHRKSQAVAERLGLRSRGLTTAFYDIEMLHFIARREDLV